MLGADHPPASDRWAKDGYRPAPAKGRSALRDGDAGSALRQRKKALPPVIGARQDDAVRGFMRQEAIR